MNYLLTSSIIFFLLGITWKKSDWYNLIAKVIMIVLAIWGFILYLKEIGYLIKV